MSKVYSYVRFSTLEQSKGNSLQRQMESSRSYCLENNLILDESLNLMDLGISAFKGNNAATGKLGAFIQAVDEGIVESGSTLLVESLDRLSRTEVLSSLSLFTSILDKGITIVTLSDKKVYTRESISDIGNLLFSLIIMSRAHEESAMKSQRIKAAWDNKKVKAHEQGIPLTKCCPAWLEIIDGKYKIKDGSVKAIQRIFEMYNKGFGYGLIVKEMNEHFSTFNWFSRKATQWHQSYVVRVLNNKAVIGEFEGVQGYYPRIISDADWLQSQQIKESKGYKSGGKKAAQVNLFAHISKCGYCGGSMTRYNKSGNRNNGYYVNTGVVCHNGRQGITDCTSVMWNMKELEPLLLRTLTELDIDKVIGVTDLTLIHKLENSILETKHKIKTSSEMKEKFMEAIIVGGNIETIVNRIKVIEGEEVVLNNTLKELKHNLKIETSKNETAKNAQNSIKLLMNKLDDPEVRTYVNSEIKKIVSRIVLFNKIKKFTIEYKSSKVKIVFKGSNRVNELPPKRDDEIIWE